MRVLGDIFLVLPLFQVFVIVEESVFGALFSSVSGTWESQPWSVDWLSSNNIRAFYRDCLWCKSTIDK
jgi:hypothetical protein